MPRQTRIINFSLLPEMVKEVDRLAKERKVSRSEILREALEQYIKSEKLWQKIYKIGEETVKELKIKEEDVERMIQEFRKEKR
ncbi:ribbon-helix-helix domain-containing protein [Candidatus Aminicenantes bacterium AC-708-M15]|jgi:metal-responsive CopG/Arc/MetJ family transcriptional regulator|nr:ribbon-helix-helix domain-containing protein [SCandidatus Aminicenantes bacterium Aminicenantia_JdfR_composite]MCP2604203.1 ribbon-helix-helix domain-containing protein [Candidatus Aminicenantes bacterium AC-708-M15]MCP2606363.1 ribbon-helix-helix domain-containing protein [Candidatus Aminicenantes bacterium AC-708-I09]MCP2618615.1 ribbon-helix-helix domain-containing protein [Candidatus Aminicenantes bacterium AC-335-A11]